MDKYLVITVIMFGLCFITLSMILLYIVHGANVNASANQNQKGINFDFFVVAGF